MAAGSCHPIHQHVSSCQHIGWQSLLKPGFGSPALSSLLLQCWKMLAEWWLQHRPCLCRPMEKYAPWFETVLKAARMAVCILQMLANEVRC